jgi:AraC-like DNA-binding protein
MIRFGAWSTLLGVLTIQLIVLAAIVCRSRVNGSANVYLAALLVILAGMLVPFVIGYAGVYDAYPWLTAAPFSISLAVGPLFYAYVRALAAGRRLPAVHFAAPALQFAYQAVLFPFPVAVKWWWDDSVHEPFVGPLMSAAVLLSLAYYAHAAWKMLRRYDSWLAERRRDPRPAKRLRLTVLLLAALLSVRAGYELFDALVRPTDYFDWFGFYVLLGIMGLLIGLDGWRNAGAAAPPIAQAPEPDWVALGREWVARLHEQGWWRDPDLTLAGLARHLGTNTNHLSRALNASHDGFAAIVSRLRAEAVAGAIDAGAEEDLLPLALAAGFGSKASFNRSFRARYGVSPTEYRAERQRLNA